MHSVDGRYWELSPGGRLWFIEREINRIKWYIRRAEAKLERSRAQMQKHEREVEDLKERERRLYEDLARTRDALGRVG